MSRPRSRRKFIKNASLGALALPLLSDLVPTALSDSSHKWGIILNTVRHDMEQDYRGCLEQLAAMGYTYIEGGTYGDSPEAYGKYLKELGLVPIVAGSSMENLQKNLFTLIREAHALTHKFLTCYWPWLGDAKNLTYDECMLTAERLNEMGKLFKKEGLRFTWHNHDKEFATVGEKTAFDILMENTDPDWVGVQMDIYWVHKGNHDPIDLFKTYPGRFDLVHVKDMDTSEERGITCVGSGKIDFEAIFSHAELAGIQYATVEHERTEEGEGIPCAQSSIDHLKQLP